MAQPNTNSVLSAYEMLANAHAKRSDSMMIFANQIANNFNDIDDILPTHKCGGF